MTRSLCRSTRNAEQNERNDPHIPDSHATVIRQCKRCDILKPTNEFVRDWDPGIGAYKAADHCVECKYLQQCPKCHMFLESEEFIRRSEGKEEPTKWCSDCRTADSTRKRVAREVKATATAIAQSEAMERIDWDDFVDLAISSYIILKVSLTKQVP